MLVFSSPLITDTGGASLEIIPGSDQREHVDFWSIVQNNRIVMIVKRGKNTIKSIQLKGNKRHRSDIPSERVNCVVNLWMAIMVNVPLCHLIQKVCGVGVANISILILLVLSNIISRVCFLLSVPHNEDLSDIRIVFKYVGLVISKHTTLYKLQ